MQVPQIIKKATTSYVERFKENPEGMAASYACLALAFGISYAGLCIAIKELDKKENQLIDVIISYEKHKAYVAGVNDAYDSIREIDSNRKDRKKY